MTTIRAADLKRGDGVIFRGEHRVVEAVRRDPRNVKVVDLHFFGVARWFEVSPNSQIEIEDARPEGVRMTTIKAADLPMGSVVASDRTAWIRANSTEWWSTSGSTASDHRIDQALQTGGAKVLRVGA